MMRPGELEGKSVITPDAKLVGTVSGVEIDVLQWKVTHLRVELTNELVQTLGYKKPFLGHVEIPLPVEVVKAIADVVSLNKKFSELKEVIEPEKEKPLTGGSLGV